MRKIIAILLLAVLFTSIGVLAAKENKTPVQEQERERLREQVREQIRELKFEMHENRYMGSFTDFKCEEKISNYTIDGTVVFESIEISPPQKVKSAGAEIKIEIANGVKVDIHDNPTGLLKIDAVKNTVVNLTVASDININVINNRTILLSNMNFNGTLMIAGQGSFEVKDNIINATLVHGKLIFRAKPCLDYGERVTYREMMREMEQNHVGAELHIRGKNALDVVIYTDLTLNITSVDGENKTISVVVNSPTPEGKFIVFNIDKEVLGAIQSGDFKVMIDGKEIPQASSIQDLINARIKNETSKYLVTLGADGAQVIVYVQKFSEHVITIQAGIPSAVPGFELFTIAVALVSALILRRNFSN
ncbi:MAG: hypothetical protein QXJ68_03765 [Methanocellales archaeon]